MFPYEWGAVPMGYPAGLTPDFYAMNRLALQDLPEEVRAALEDRQEEIHNESDLHRLVNEMMLRR